MTREFASSSHPVLAVDAMGGDGGPTVTLAGMALALQAYPQCTCLLFGDEQVLRPVLKKFPILQQAVRGIVHTDDVITNDDKPSVALRQGRSSSMRLAINAVAEGQADAIISAGNTGALMAMAKFVLKTYPEIDRPAIVSLMPTLKHDTVLLDLGANTECSADNLVQFGIMGAMYCMAVRKVTRPTVRILNIGAETLKGHDLVKQAALSLSQIEFPGVYEGFIEGDDIGKGMADVVVTDGFTGNVALKVAEGTSRLYSAWLREQFTSTWRAKLGYLVARPALQALRARVDPRHYNGALLIGLRGVCIKSHGGTDAIGFANAVEVGLQLVTSNFQKSLHQEFERYAGRMVGAIA